jgi:hypothetical protein
LELPPPPPHAVNVVARLTAIQSAALCCEFFIEILPVLLMHFHRIVSRFHFAGQ